MWRDSQRIGLRREYEKVIRHVLRMMLGPLRVHVGLKYVA